MQCAKPISLGCLAVLLFCSGPPACDGQATPAGNKGSPSAEIGGPQKRPPHRGSKELNDLTPEHLYLCLGMALMVGVVIIVIYCSTIRKMPGEAAGPLSRDLLPLITVGVIVAGAFKLAVLGVIEGPAIGALYSAIAGYVLGRGGRFSNGGGQQGGAAAPQPPPPPTTSSFPPNSIQQ